MRYQLAETTYVLGLFETGETVTIAVYDLSDGSSVGLDSATCAEIGTTGVFRWAVTDITIAPSVYTEYLYVMTDSGGLKQYGKIVMGGYVDEIDQSLSTTETNIIAEVDANETKIDLIQTDTTAILDDTDTMEADLKTYMDTIEDNIRGSDDDDLKDISDEIFAISVDNAAIADAVWNESKSGHTGDLKTMADNLDQSLSTTESNIRGSDNDDLKDISDELATITGGTTTVTIDVDALVEAILEAKLSKYQNKRESLAEAIRKILTRVSIR